MTKKRVNTFVLLVFAFLNFNLVALAQNSECKDKLVAFEELASANDYDDSTYEPWLELKKKCSKFDESVYILGEKILSQKVNKANASEAKNVLIMELANLYDEHDKTFPNNKRGNQISKALLLFENKVGTEDEIYSFLDKAFKTDYENFSSPNVLNIYSQLVVSQFEAGDKGITKEQAFEKLDKISEKVQLEKKTIVQSSENLDLKSQTLALTDEEKRTLRNSKNTLEELALVSGNLEGRMNNLADCETLNALYQKDFEKNATNELWLERAADRLLAKKCNSSLSIAISEKLHEIKPSSKSAYNMAVISRTARNNKLAAEYFSEAANLETNSNKKAELYYTLATTYGYIDKTKAREAVLKALEAKPSMGKAYTYLSQLYANSTNDCGENGFESKAVYWLAAETAKKAGVVEPILKKSADDLAAAFMKKAPSKQEISSSKRKAGQQIAIQCWINETISIPKL